ncbi:unnamed protein product [Closterium sp. NIES-64]|nr:unnamed protein product [Closterium sp. NIES-64]
MASAPHSPLPHNRFPVTPPSALPFLAPSRLGIHTLSGRLWSPPLPLTNPRTHPLLAPPLPNSPTFCSPSLPPFFQPPLTVRPPLGLAPSFPSSCPNPFLPFPHGLRDCPQPKLSPSLCPPLSSPYVPPLHLLSSNQARFHPLPGSLVAAFTPSPPTHPLTSLNPPALPSRYLACPPLFPPPTLLPPGQILGARPAPDAFRKDPGFLFIGLDTDIEPWTCVLCNFTCGPALESAMAHMDSEAHTSNLHAAAKGPAAKEKYSIWRALTFLATPQIASFLSQ